MAFNETPRIRWKTVLMEGDSTIGSSIITNMPSTANLVIGQKVESDSFAADTTIVGIIDGTSVEVSTNALDTNYFERLFYFEFIFRYPAVKNDGEDIVVKDRTSTSISGARQVSVDFVEYKLELEFTFLTLDELDTLRFFWESWAGLGYEFEYYPDKDSTVFITYEKDTNSFKPSKATPVLYKVAFKFRRVE